MKKKMYFIGIATICSLSASAGHFEVSEATESVCGFTNVGRPMKNAPTPPHPRNSDDVINALGSPFWAGFETDPDTHEKIDTIVYVDALVRGSGDLKQSYSESCGVEVIYQFKGTNWERNTIKALQNNEIVKMYENSYRGTQAYEAVKNQLWIRVTE
ncbi:hypothetical protein HW511_09705 [Asaia siamensis]|uniref:Uncharacterized protein n=1 Tax=Asaia siamensis TaxID=110479 RepID=A0ABQ1LXI9_9PROT|nr:hypothetical protein [Asaia siamensis]GBR10592.1 hypothetical protein AA0323_2862 [Asaia siamensis NRIC 0323]GGC31687.1 hypothetical protein GCM10007207_16460 [Asaia siamensis]